MKSNSKDNGKRVYSTLGLFLCKTSGKYASNRLRLMLGFVGPHCGIGSLEKGFVDRKLALILECQDLRIFRVHDKAPLRQIAERDVQTGSWSCAVGFIGIMGKKTEATIV